MLQRNDTGQPLVLPTLDPPLWVNPGDLVDVDVELAGFSAVKGKAPADTPTAALLVIPEPAVDPIPADTTITDATPAAATEKETTP